MPQNRLFLRSRFAAHHEISLQNLMAHHSQQKSPSLVNTLNYLNQFFFASRFLRYYGEKMSIYLYNHSLFWEKLICTNFQMPVPGMTNLVQCTYMTDHGTHRLYPCTQPSKIFPLSTSKSQNLLTEKYKHTVHQECFKRSIKYEIHTRSTYTKCSFSKLDLSFSSPGNR